MGQHRFGMKEVIDEVDDRRRFMHLVDRRAKLRTPADPMSEIRRELLHLTDAIGFLGALLEHGVVRAHHLVPVLVSWLIIPAAGQVLLNLAEDPWIATG